MSIQTLSSIISMTFYAAGEILGILFDETGKIALAVKDLFDNGIPLQESTRLSSLRNKVEKGFQSLPSLGISSLPLSISEQLFSKASPPRPTYDLKGHFQRINRKGRPTEGYRKAAPPPPKPKTSLLQMMSERTPPRGSKTVQSRSKLGNPFLPPPPSSEEPLKSESTIKTLLIESLTKPLTEAEKGVYRLGNRLYKLGVFGLESWKEFLSFTYEQQQSLLTAAQEKLPLQNLGEKYNEARDAISGLAEALYFSKDDHKDGLKSEMHTILNEFIEIDFMQQGDVSKFLVLNIVNQMEVINNGIKETTVKNSPFAREQKKLVRLAQIIYELHRLDLPASSFEEQITNEIKTILTQVDVVGAIPGLTDKTFTKMPIEKQFKELDGAIRQIEDSLPEFRPLIPNMKKLKELIAKVAIYNALVDLEKLGVLFDGGIPQFQRMAVPQQLDAIHIIKPSIDPFSKEDPFPKLEYLEKVLNLLGSLK